MLLMPFLFLLASRVVEAVLDKIQSLALWCQEVENRAHILLVQIKAVKLWDLLIVATIYIYIYHGSNAVVLALVFSISEKGNRS